ncbi:small integral membrane protein 7 [Plakobranchus ocellatus]|uniref:Small integral membrane protein 7 n=1 Tax=Plakobranchus ocellatus TaxID=259542 RepID=A0AAV4CZ86_9GAST|nr:small integral membrane protein 7 [Plakobranchus ocellatus]
MYQTDLLICAREILAAAQDLKRKREEGSYATDESLTAGDKIRDFLLSLRHLRIFIGLWNIFIIFLMLVFFSH